MLFIETVSDTFITENRFKKRFNICLRISKTCIEVIHDTLCLLRVISETLKIIFIDCKRDTFFADIVKICCDTFYRFFCRLAANHFVLADQISATC